MGELSGGRQGKIFRQGETVLRPLQPWSSSVHHLLNFLHENGFDQCPQFIAVEGTQERLSFIVGDSYNYPLTGQVATEQALISAARLQRRLHEQTRRYLQQHGHQRTWMLPTVEPAELICHGDFTPYNVALDGTEVCGVFDFDTAHPAPVLWDVAFSVYAWAPLKQEDPALYGTFEQQCQRARIYCDAYGLETAQRKQLPQFMIRRLQALVDFMAQQALQGDETFQQNIDEGHAAAYRLDMQYIENNRDTLVDYLVSEK